MFLHVLLSKMVGKVVDDGGLSLRGKKLFGVELEPV
jgi:hypothetical protein